MRVHFKTKKRQHKVVANNKQNAVLKEQWMRSRKNIVSIIMLYTQVISFSIDDWAHKK